MTRLAAVALILLAVWGLVPTVGELVENAAHLLLEGHSAHNAPDGHHHEPAGPEHGCGGAVHLCSCCVSLSCLPTVGLAEVRAPETVERLAITAEQIAGSPSYGVYHPPRA